MANNKYLTRYVFGGALAGLAGLASLSGVMWLWQHYTYIMNTGAFLVFAVFVGMFAGAMVWEDRRQKGKFNSK
jgi:hypothetical protein